MCYGTITLRIFRWLTVVAVTLNICHCIPGWTLIVPTGLRNDKVTPCSIVLFEKLIFPQSLRKFPAFCGIRWLINRVHSTQPLVPLFNQINPVHFLPSYFFRSIIISPSHLCLCIPVGLLPSGFPTKTCMHFSSVPRALHAPPISLPLILSYE